MVHLASVMAPFRELQGAKEVTQQLRGLTGLAEALGLVSSTHTEAYNHL